MSAQSANIARNLPCIAAHHPNVPALKIPRGRLRDGSIDYLTLSFAELAAEVAAWAQHLDARGVRPGDRCLVMVRPGLPLIAVVFALFARGALPIVIDPGMGRTSFLKCVARAQPTVLVGIPLARFFSHVFRRAFATVKLRIAVSSSATARRPLHGASAGDLGKLIITREPTDPAAILFTSGSTGTPKGVCYEHGMFDAQVQLIRETYGIEPGEIDLPMLPIFALFNPALGMTTIVPEIDPTRPAAVDPAKIVQAILQEKVTTSFGSPILWLKVAQYCAAEGITLPNMRRVLSAGAPVPPALWELAPKMLPHGQMHSPYGATEALPISSIAATTVLSETAAQTLRGAGTCVGHPLQTNTVRIISPHDGPLADLAHATFLPTGQIGEIIVAGPTVTRAYDGLPDATADAKIPHGDGADYEPTFYHRMGDMGYLDKQGQLWFCGRKAERVRTDEGWWYTEQIEPAFNAHPKVRRSALIGITHRGHARRALVIEPTDPKVLNDSDAARNLARELRASVTDHPIASEIKVFYFHPGFPVDVRHNAKIHRLTLTTWAKTARGFETDTKR